MKSSRREELWQRISTDSLSGRPLSASPNAESPWPGTLWVHPATAAFAVEWLVVAWGNQKPQACLLVPADCRPILGATDVSIPAGDLGGPLAVRCHLGQWVPPDILNQAQASGQIAGSTLSLIRDRHVQSRDSTAADLLLGRDGGPSPAYEDWVDDLRQAWIALRATLPETQDSNPRAAPPWLAACAVLVITLGAGATWYFGHHDWHSLGPEFSQGTNGESPSNLAQIVMNTAVTRSAGPDGELLLPPDAEHVLIYIVLDSEPRYPIYRVDILDLESGTRVWSADQLKPLDNGTAVTLSTIIPKQVLMRPATETVDDAIVDVALPVVKRGFQVRLEGLSGEHWIAVTRHIVQPRIPSPESDND